MAVYNQHLTNNHDASVHQALKDIISNDVVHPIDEFVDEMMEGDMDTIFDRRDLSPSPTMSLEPIPVSSHHRDASSTTTNPSPRRTHKRAVTMDGNSFAPQNQDITADDWKIGIEQLLDIEPTPVAELMTQEPIPLEIPPSPPTSSVLAPVVNPPLLLPEEMPSARTVSQDPPVASNLLDPIPSVSPQGGAFSNMPVIDPLQELEPITTSSAPIKAPSVFPSPVFSAAVLPLKHEKQTKRGRTSKKQSQTVQYIDEVTDLDCVLGRGGKSNHHPGNKRYRSEVQHLQKWYKSSGKAEKTDLAQCLVNFVHSYGGRFVKQEKSTGRWYVVSNLVARRKASQALREHMTMEERQAKKAAMLAAATSETNTSV
jgi:hypothetical protein